MIKSDNYLLYFMEISRNPLTNGGIYVILRVRQIAYCLRGAERSSYYLGP